MRNTILITKLFKIWTAGVFIEEGKGQTTAVSLEGQPDRKAPSLTLLYKPKECEYNYASSGIWAQNTGHV